ncbi:hypothetical protein MNBD_PLANCTO02-2687, partial [hydrothermal vent metagenome]
MPLPVNPTYLEQHIETIASLPRPAESKELEKARAYVSEKFEEYGWAVTPVPFTTTDDDGTKLNGINLVAQHSFFSSDTNPSQ